MRSFDLAKFQRNFQVKQIVILFALRRADCGEMMFFVGLCSEPCGESAPEPSLHPRRGTFLTTRKYSRKCQAGQRAAFFLPALQGNGTKAKMRCRSLPQSLLKVEVELKYFLRYMPVGVLTYPQLRRELRRCVELGEPWPFVLAVIPSSSTRPKLFAGRRKVFMFPWLQLPAIRRLRPV
ncbi:MAG TPA: hypothetical protein VHC39_05710 [Rhizomicrobium sp.]|nr:hypothetical protein [Rhizomicrobium sp.]